MWRTKIVFVGWCKGTGHGSKNLQEGNNHPTKKLPIFYDILKVYENAVFFYFYSILSLFSVDEIIVCEVGICLLERKHAHKYHFLDSITGCLLKRFG